MTVRQLLNAYINEWHFVKVNDFIGDTSSIGADLEEDYGRIGVYPDMRTIPESVLSRKVEYFGIESGDYGNEVVIYLESK